MRSRLPSARVEANSAKEEAAHQQPKRPSQHQNPAVLIMGQTYWLLFHRPWQADHGKLYSSTYQSVDCGVGSWDWLDQSKSEKVARLPLAQLLVLHLLSAEELQAAREVPELHQGDLRARMRQRARGLRLLGLESEEKHQQGFYFDLHDFLTGPLQGSQRAPRD